MLCPADTNTKRKDTMKIVSFLFGAANQIRTGDLILTKDVLYHLSHSSTHNIDYYNGNLNKSQALFYLLLKKTPLFRAEF